jgi:single-stranded-DNA-specific exonuclease
MVDDLIKAMERAIGELRRWPKEAVQIFHHNDSDGLSSGAILTRAFEREGYEVRRICLEKPYPEVLRRVYEQEGKIFVLADFAGRIAPLLSRMNRERNLTLIIDHHPAEEPTDPKVHNLDPELYGLKGDRDIAAATTCFLFARTLNPANVDLAYLGAVGAVGDKFFVDGRLVSQNREVTMEASRQGRVEIGEHQGGEHYILEFAGRRIRCDHLGVYLDMLGGAGYYQGGPNMGVRVLLEGMTRESDEMVQALDSTKEKAFVEEKGRLHKGAMKTSPHIQWFNVEKRFAPMGVKMIGLFCEAIRSEGFIDPRKYIAGFQTVPDEIPGFGAIAFNQVKISMRVPPAMEQEIRAGRAMGLNTFLPEATNRLGGFSDACHSLTAATTVAIGKEEALIEEMEKILTQNSPNPPF